jgi:hypothetical protein
MTVGELERRLTWAELLEWSVVFKIEQEAHEKALQKAETGKGKTRRRR